MARDLQASCWNPSDAIRDLDNRGQWMMNRKYVTTSSATFAALPATQETGLKHGGAASDRLGLEMLSGVSGFDEETLVIDARSSLSPAQMVETKLSRKLQETSLPVSHLQMRGLLRRR